MENKILSAIKYSREAYEALKPVISENDFTDQGKILLKVFREYYDKDSAAKETDPELVAERIEQEYPRHSRLLGTALEALEPVSIPNVMEVYTGLQIISISHELSALLAAGKNTVEVIDLMDRYRRLVEAKDSSFFEDTNYDLIVDMPVEDIIEVRAKDNLVPIAPNNLNTILDGGVPRGSHVVLFARPEIGKTLFSINLASHMLETGRKVLYLGNEDPYKVMLERFICRLSLMDRFKQIKNPKKATEKAKAKGYDNLIFMSTDHGSVIDLTRVAEKHEVDVIVVDQMRNLKPKKELSKVETLEVVAQDLRALYKRLDVVGISITQAGDSAENKSVLELGDIDFSNTGIPSTADLMIGLGATENMKAKRYVKISLPKNKISAVHDVCNVVMDPWLSTVTGLD